MEYKLLNEQQDSNLSILEQVFINRGIDLSDIDHYLNTTEEDIIDPNELLNMRQGAQMLIKHLQQNDKITIQVDPDADGYTSAAALLNYLYSIFPAYVLNNFCYILHSGKQHGIIVENVPPKTKLLIVPDAGSSDYEQHKQLRDKGIDILVIDHHETDKLSENACIINNQIGNYKNKTLSGVGVVYKLCQYLDKLLNKNNSNSILDLTALGIISDMVDLRSFETREIIKKGLDNICNPFFTAFIDVQKNSLKGIISPSNIAFYITPYINATIRIGSPEEKLRLFESMLVYKADEQIPSTKRGCKGELETIVAQACRNCTNIKKRQTKLRDTSLETIRQVIIKNELNTKPILIIQSDNPIEETLTGLIANQLMDEYQKPVLLLNRYIETDPATGEVTKFAWRGSGRNFTYSKLRSLRELINNSNLAEYAQGHANAFGVSILAENIEQFKQYMYNALANFDTSICYYVDFIWNSTNVSANAVRILADLSDYWGQGLPEPKVVIENICLTKNNLSLMGLEKNVPTIKIVFPDNLSLIKFKSSEQEYENLYSENGCVNINIVGTCQLNYWNGKVMPQIIIEDYEIVNKSAYYF